MNETEMRIAIAESVGSLAHDFDETKQCKRCYQFEHEDKFNHCVLAEFPDYPNDLNAMHEVKKTLDWVADDEYCEAAQFCEHLIFICGRNLPKAGKAMGGEQIYDSQETEHTNDGLCHSECPKADCYDWHLITATAHQHAEAYLRTKGLWT